MILPSSLEFKFWDFEDSLNHQLPGTVWTHMFQISDYHI